MDLKLSVAILFAIAQNHQPQIVFNVFKLLHAYPGMLCLILIGKISNIHC
jgi:hypothetical protein